MDRPPSARRRHERSARERDDVLGDPAHSRSRASRPPRPAEGGNPSTQRRRVGVRSELDATTDADVARSPLRRTGSRSAEASDVEMASGACSRRSTAIPEPRDIDLRERLRATLSSIRRIATRRPRRFRVSATGTLQSADAISPPEAELEEQQAARLQRTRTTTMATMEAETIRDAARGCVPGRGQLDVEDRTGGGDHFQVTVVSAAFDGLPLLDQHRRVNDALAAPLGDGSIHELRIRTQRRKERHEAPERADLRRDRARSRSPCS